MSPDGESWKMFVAAHRDRAPRRRAGRSHKHALILTADSRVQRWVEYELFGERVTTQFVDTLVEVVTTLTLTPPPWPQLLIVDVAALSPAEIDLLGTIRAAGWPGGVIAVGDPPPEMRRSLAIDRVLSNTLMRGALRVALKYVGTERVTVPMRRIAR